MAENNKNKTASELGTGTVVEAKDTVKTGAEQSKKVANDQKAVKDQKRDKKKKDKKPSKLGKKVKETTSELKKVTWPTFGSVVKKTGVVLAVVLIFAVVLFGIDRLLAWIFSLLIHSVA